MTKLRKERQRRARIDAAVRTEARSLGIKSPFVETASIGRLLYSIERQKENARRKVAG